MKRPYDIAWVLVSLLSAGAFVQVVAAAVPAGTNLAFKFKPGDVTPYKHSITMEIRSATLPKGTMVVTEEYIETNKVLSVDADGSAEVESITSSFVQKANGEKTPATRSMLTGIPQNTPIIHQVSKDGRVLNSRVRKDLSLADKITTEAALRKLKNRGLQLPEKALVIGESWRSEEWISNKIPGLGVMDTKLTMNYTLSSREEVLGFQCVKILLAGSGTGTMSEGKGSNEIKLKGTLWFAPDKGDLIKMTMEQIEKLMLTGPNGPIEMDTNAVASIELIP